MIPETRMARNPHTFSRAIELLEAVQQSVSIHMYVWRNDHTGTAMGSGPPWTACFPNPRMDGYPGGRGVDPEYGPAHGVIAKIDNESRLTGLIDGLVNLRKRGIL